MSGVITGSEERKEKLSEAVFGTMRSKHGADCHVATSPRRDVRSRICISSFNVRTARKLGHREAYEQRHGFAEPEDPDFGRVPGICTAFHFVRYYLGYDDDVLDTRHCVLFVHDVLDLFLGLHQTLSQTMD